MKETDGGSGIHNRTETEQCNQLLMMASRAATTSPLCSRSTFSAQALLTSSSLICTVGVLTSGYIYHNFCTYNQFNVLLFHLHLLQFLLLSHPQLVLFAALITELFYCLRGGINIRTLPMYICIFLLTLEIFAAEISFSSA